MFEVWLCVIYVYEQNAKFSSSSVNHRAYFTHKSKTALENPEGIHGSKMLILLRGLRLQTTTALTSRAYEFECNCIEKVFPLKCRTEDWRCLMWQTHLFGLLCFVPVTGVSVKSSASNSADPLWYWELNAWTANGLDMPVGSCGHLLGLSITLSWHHGENLVLACERLKGKDCSCKIGYWAFVIIVEDKLALWTS